MDTFYEKLIRSFIDGHHTVETLHLIENMHDIKDTLLQIVKKNNIALLKLIIYRRPDIKLNVTDDQKKSLLLLSLIAENYEIAKLLINFGVNVNLADNDKMTPLHVAVNKNILELVSILLYHQANINAQLSTGDTPLMSLCSSNHSNRCMKRMMDLLLINGADINIRNNLGHTAIVQFMNPRELVNADNIMQLIEHGCNLEDVDYMGNTILHLAVESNYKSIVRRLVIAGVNVDSRNSTGATALHVAVKNVEIACILLYYGANPNYVDQHNDSPLINSLLFARRNYQLSELLFFSYDGLNGNDCHKVFCTILENPLAHKRDMAITVAMLDKFQEFIKNTKVPFRKYLFSKLSLNWRPNCKKQCYAAAEHIMHLNIKMKNYNLTEYIDFNTLYYGKLVSASGENRNLRANILKLIWYSLSIGITCVLPDLISVWEQLGFENELFALIWGSFHQELVDNINDSTRFPNRDSWGYYLKLLHFDVVLENRQITDQLVYDHGEITFSRKYQVKTLAELSRDKARKFIKQQFKTKTFYDVHEVLNNLDLPKRIKWALQLKTQLNCDICKFKWCQCN